MRSKATSISANRFRCGWPDGRSIEVDVYLVRDEFRDSLSDELWDADEFRANHLNSFIGPQRIH